MSKTIKFAYYLGIGYLSIFVIAMLALIGLSFALNVISLLENITLTTLFFLSLMPGLTVLFSGVFLLTFGRGNLYLSNNDQLSYPAYNHKEIKFVPSYFPTRTSPIRILGGLWIAMSVYGGIFQYYLFFNEAFRDSYLQNLQFYILIGVIAFIMEIILTNLLPKFDPFRKIWIFNNIKLLFGLFLNIFLLSRTGVSRAATVILNPSYIFTFVVIYYLKQMSVRYQISIQT